MEPIDKARQILTAAKRPVAFTGAGVSADSGVPTFRGASGDTFWGKYDPMQLASPQGFRADPKLVYDWYNWRRSQLATILPNPAHHAIARLQQRTGAAVITQNVDGLHERVAPPQGLVHAVHGSLAFDRCNSPTCDYEEEVDFAKPLPLRKCPLCGEYLRPGVVWFGEALDEALWQICLWACEEADAMLVVGTSGEVYPAAGLVDVARRSGAPVVLVNLEPGPFDARVEVALHGRAGEIVPRILEK